MTLCAICDEPVKKAVALANTGQTQWACYKCFKNPVRRERFYKKQAAYRRRLARLSDLLFK